MKILTKDLEILVKRLNVMTNSPLEPYSKDKKGKFKANPGCYLLDWAYGGVCLRRIDNDKGGESCPINSGYVTKRELYMLMHAYMNGLGEK